MIAIASESRRLTDEQRELASRPEVLALARTIAAKFCKRMPARYQDDVYGAAHVGVVQAAATFDPSQGFKFTTFADKRIRGAIVDMIRDTRNVGGMRITRGMQASGETFANCVSFDTLICKPDMRDMQFIDFVRSAEPDPSERLASADGFKDLVRGLPGDHRFALWLIYVRGMNLKQAGEVIGLCESRISQMRSEAFGLIRERLAARGDD